MRDKVESSISVDLVPSHGITQTPRKKMAEIEREREQRKRLKQQRILFMCLQV
jgi:hypothetical protein